MAQNVEIKARCADLSTAAARALAAGAVDRGVLVQHDTFYRVPAGRLKLRRIGGDRAELIFYHRPDTPAARMSEYQIVPVPDPDAMHALLSTALGAAAEVRKRRRLLLWKNVRIHLDEVEGLGSFIELEAVVGPDADAAESARRLAEMQQVLRIGPGDLVDRAYAEL